MFNRVENVFLILCIIASLAVLYPYRHHLPDTQGWVLLMVIEFAGLALGRNYSKWKSKKGF